MKFYLSEKGVKRLTLAEEDDSGGGGKVAGFRVKMKEKKGSEAGGARRLFSRSVLLSVLLMLSLFLPFILVRIAFLTLESATVYSSSLECLAWSFLGGNEAVLLRDELTKALAETTKINSGKDGDGDGDGESLYSTLLLPESFKDLVTDVTYNKRDINSFASMAKAMMAKMEHKLKLARRQENTYWHLASHGVPKSIQCLSLVLAEEYVINSMARSHLPSPEFAYRLSDPSFHHVVLLTDNVIAASVAISSTVKSSIDCKKLVFHVITDSKTYTAMHAWFAVNNTDSSAVVEVKGLHQYDWSNEVNIDVKELLEIHRLIFEKNLEFLSPSRVSLLNHMRIYMTELFPDLDKILFLDDDVVVQHDLSSLWQMDLNGKVVSAVVDSWCGHGCCPGRKYKNFFNFTNSIISSLSKLHEDQCGWLYGVNIFDLQAWRKTNITKTYHQLLKINMNSNFTLWKPGVLPPAILAFEGHVHPINSSWHMAGLGQRSIEYFNKSVLENAAVLHFSGPAKPWLEISDIEVRRLWYKHVNSSNGFVYQCGITA